MLVQVSIKGLIENRGKYLVLKQKTKNKVHFTLPGGRIGFRENIIEGLKREIKEETNLTVDVFDPVGVWGFKMDSENENPYVACITLLCKVRGKTKIKLQKVDGNSSIIGSKWVAKKELKKLKAEDSLIRVFKDFCS